MAITTVQKRLPWTELFRPRTLDEVILTRKQRAQILGWWRAWIILWNLIRIWNSDERGKWYAFSHTNEGREWVSRFLNKWKDFFKKKFEEWAGVKSSREVPSSHMLLFNQLDKKKELSTDLKPTAQKEIRKWLDKIWGEFLSQINSKIIPPAVPPLAPYKPILLVGPPGTGKTTTVYALAGQEGVLVVEFNASDRRNSTVIREVVREAMKSAGFVFGGNINKPPRIILLDEVDGLSGRDDRGGFSALIRALDDIKFPLALTANVMHDRKVRFLMTKSITVFFDRPYDYQIKTLIMRIAKRMNMSIPESIINFLSKYAPDFRTVVEALEVYYHTGILPEIFHEEMINIQDAIRYAFGFKGESLEQSAARALRYLNSITDIDPWDIILWVWENAYNFLDKDKGISGFYKELAYADYLYRIGARNMNWRIAYRDSMNVLAHAMAKYGKATKNIWALRKIRVNKPTIVEELGRMKRLMEGEIELTEEEERESEITAKKLGLRPLLELYGKYTHISRRRARRELRFLKHLALNNPRKAGVLFAKLYIPKETIQIFLRYFFKPKEREKIEKEVLNAYEEAIKSIGPKVITFGASAETATDVEVREAEEIKEEAKKKEPEKVKEEEKKTTLDMFFG